MREDIQDGRGVTCGDRSTLTFASGLSNKSDKMTFLIEQNPKNLSLREPKSNNAVAMNI